MIVGDNNIFSSRTHESQEYFSHANRIWLKVLKKHLRNNCLIVIMMPISVHSLIFIQIFYLGVSRSKLFHIGRYILEYKSSVHQSKTALQWSRTHTVSKPYHTIFIIKCHYMYNTLWQNIYMHAFSISLFFKYVSFQHITSHNHMYYTINLNIYHVYKMNQLLKNTFIIIIGFFFLHNRLILNDYILWFHSYSFINLFS